MESNTYGRLGAASTALGGLTSLAGAYAESRAIAAQSEFQRTLARINARLAAKRSESTLKAGEEQAQAIRRKGKQVAGAQRAAAAAQGLDVNDAGGSVSDQLIDTEQAVAADMLNTRNNAWREAWGIRTESAFGMLKSDQRAAAAKFAGNQTLLTGGLKALSSGSQAAAQWRATIKPSSSSEYHGSLNVPINRQYITNREW